MKFKPLELTDVVTLMYRNEHSVLVNLRDPMMYGEIETAKWLQNLPSSSKRWGIWEKTSINLDEDKEHFVGVIRIDEIDNVNRTCMVGMDILPQFQGKHFSSEAYPRLLNYLFYDLNFHMVHLEVLASNQRAINLYQRIGFEKTGYLPQAIYRDGVRWNYLIYSLLRDKYKALLDIRW